MQKAVTYRQNVQVETTHGAAARYLRRRANENGGGLSHGFKWNARMNGAAFLFWGQLLKARGERALRQMADSSSLLLLFFFCFATLKLRAS